MAKKSKNCVGCDEQGKPGEDACLINSEYGMPTCVRTPAVTEVHCNGFGRTTFETIPVVIINQPAKKEKKKKGL